MVEGALDRLVHDLFGPLTVIRGVCATLARDEPRDERRAGLALIDAETMRLGGGPRRSRAGRARPCALGLAAGPGLPGLAGRLRRRAPWRGGRRAGRRRPGRARPRPRPTVTATADDLRRALDNLVQNALRHCAWGCASPSAAAADGRYVRVADDGAGVAPADRERIFRPGDRGERPARDGARPGLGDRPRAGRGPRRAAHARLGGSEAPPSAWRCRCAGRAPGGRRDGHRGRGGWRPPSRVRGLEGVVVVPRSPRRRRGWARPRPRRRGRRAGARRHPRPGARATRPGGPRRARPPCTRRRHGPRGRAAAG